MRRAARPNGSSRFIARRLWALLALACATSAQARIQIDIPDVTPAIETNVRAFLSLTRYADRDDVTPETMSRLERRIGAETREALQPLGYYEPEVSYEVTQDGDDWRVTIHVRPGRPVRLSEVDIRVTGPGRDLRVLREIIDAQELKPGLRLNHGTYERVKGNLLRAAKNAGYLDAQLTESELLIDRIERRATATIVLDTGERFHYGEITIAQDVINDDAMRRMLRMEPGDPYTLDSLLRTQYVLDDSLYFSSVDIESGEPDRDQRTVPVTISAEPNRKHRFTTSIGYGSDTRMRGRFGWDNRRVNASGHRSKVELIGSSILKQLGGRYVIPVMDVALEKLEFTAAVTEEELGDTLSERAEVGAGLTEALGRWQRVLFLRLSHEQTTAPQVDPQTRQPTGMLETKEDFYLIPGISYSTLPSYVVGGRIRPYYFYAELRGSPSTLGSDASFLQLRLLGERIFDLSDLWHLHLRGEIGVSRVADFSELPASQRFFAGGERSVRGFGLNELSPKVDNKSVGGRHLATGTIELVRDLPRNFGVAAFYDFGNAFDDFSDPGLEYSAGLGVRYRIAVASFGIDVAQALSESGRSPRFHLYISTQF
ncbi:MAG: BamA/TamA family outer membrane protein [Xanthomonadaceae bacterium]|nr:BamA/TamA family outer membrane protein [Xanthomonadaceae bacterium]